MPGGAAHEQVGLFGVFDGHGGTNAADYVNANLFSNLLQNGKFATDAKTAISESRVIASQITKHVTINQTKCLAVIVCCLGKQMF